MKQTPTEIIKPNINITECSIPPCSPFRVTHVSPLSLGPRNKPSTASSCLLLLQCLAYHSVLKIKEKNSPETSVNFQRTTQKTGLFITTAVTTTRPAI
jgi:hypothetical protein